ncbi:hypothetical protein VTI28DRAFT_9439 [Corynascus sepedonium]
MLQPDKWNGGLLLCQSSTPPWQSREPVFGTFGVQRFGCRTTVAIDAMARSSVPVRVDTGIQDVCDARLMRAVGALRRSVAGAAGPPWDLVGPFYGTGGRVTEVGSLGTGGVIGFCLLRLCLWLGLTAGFFRRGTIRVGPARVGVVRLDGRLLSPLGVDSVLDRLEQI